MAKTAKVLNGVETLRKIQAAEQGARTLQTDRRHSVVCRLSVCNVRATSYSERELSLNMDRTNTILVSRNCKMTSGIVMAALLTICGYYTLPCGFFYIFSFFPRLISAVADWMCAILAHTVWP